MKKIELEKLIENIVKTQLNELGIFDKLKNMIIKNPDTGRDNKAITAYNNTEHPMHDKVAAMVAKEEPKSTNPHTKEIEAFTNTLKKTDKSGIGFTYHDLKQDIDDSKMFNDSILHKYKVKSIDDLKNIKNTNINQKELSSDIEEFEDNQKTLNIASQKMDILKQFVAKKYPSKK